ncbi:MAG: MmgE/PrpD family protein [Candidatus Bathyarchaeota archaeon]|nr:MmgE/PrpD family protein [Candidatus Bathyarchaeota archaeon]
MDSKISDEAVNFILRRNAMPQDVKAKALDHIVDGFAVMLAGSRTECARKVAGFVKGKGGNPQSTAIGLGFKAPIPDAALINGTSGHADDYDDTQLSTAPDRLYGLMTHPTVPVLAAALAVGEERGSSGREVLEAFVAGFEVECKLAETIKPAHYWKGFHTTATIGAFGAYAAVGTLFDLDEDALKASLGITASLTSGIRANFGTMTKPLHAGMAASNGVIACLLGKEGFTANMSALDGRWGFMEIMAGGSDPEMMMGKMGKPYSIVDPGATFKMYPCGCLGQPSMDTLRDIVIEEDLHEKDVREIRLRAGPNILEPLRYTDPVDDLQAKFSLQFALASILLRRRAGPREYSMEWLMDPAMQSTMRKVKTIPDEGIAAMGVEKMRSIVEVELTDGRIIRREASDARGTPEKPLKPHDLEEKFMECAGFVYDEEKSKEALALIRRLDKLSDVTELTDLLRNE